MDIQKLSENGIIPVSLISPLQKGGGIGGFGNQYGVPSGLYSSNHTIYNEYENVYDKNNDIYDFESSDDEKEEEYERQSDVLPMNIYMEMIDNVSVVDEKKGKPKTSSLKKKEKKNMDDSTKKIKKNKTNTKNVSKKNRRITSSRKKK